MDKENEDFLEEFKKIKNIKRCPHCGKLGLTFTDGKVTCSECAYISNIGSI